MQLAVILLTIIFSLTPQLLLAQKLLSPKIFANAPSTLHIKDSLSPITLDIESAPPTKSPALAALLSFILPGLGELYAGRFESGQYFLAADAALILGVTTLTVYGNIQRADYQTFARLYANVADGNKSSEFWRDIADWQSRAAFNESRLRRRQYGAIYEVADDWQWQSNLHRQRYREIWVSSETAFQSSYYVIAAMGINRLLSAINAVRLVNEGQESKLGSNILISSHAFTTLPLRTEGLMLSLSARF